ncbi:hypothetical protein HID58_044007 [Brassica napus]|uniref:Uncharacterized protein n=1 Tax=Brassica napus TaxID=3708 RepID=A0ABQ8BI54_BRANA|nr:hypothetical protein HID58_044007 [Brassica napus]
MACSPIDPASLYSSRIFLVMLMRDRPYINPGIKRRTMNGKPTIASLHSMMKATTIACPHHRHRSSTGPRLVRTVSVFARVSSGPTRSRMKTLSRLLTSSLANPSEWRR